MPFAVHLRSWQVQQKRRSTDSVRRKGSRRNLVRQLTIFVCILVFSRRRTASSTAISSKGFMACFTFVSTPLPSRRDPDLDSLLRATDVSHRSHCPFAFYTTYIVNRSLDRYQYPQFVSPKTASSCTCGVDDGHSLIFYFHSRSLTRGVCTTSNRLSNRGRPPSRV